MPTVHVEVYVNKQKGLYKIGEGDIYYTDAYQPNPTYTTTKGILTANIYCNGIKVGEVSGTFEDTVASGSGGTATKTITFTVVFN
jgi:LEA14-like dessication related protein